MTINKTREAWKSVKRAQVWNAYDLEKSVPKGHYFTFFRVGEDVCAKCRKPRKEHENG